MLTPYYQESGVTLYHGDSLAVLRELPDDSVQCCVTSPPYFGLRRYLPDGHDLARLEVGLEPSPDAYVTKLVTVFREVQRVLKPDGVLWLNLGDSYCNADKWGGGGVNTGKHTKSPDGSVPSWAAVRRKWGKIPGLKSKDLIGIPWMTAFALRADGWWLRSDIIWSKPNPMPESVQSRPTKAHEYLFLLAKSENYYFDAEAIQEPSVGQNAHDLTGPGYAAPGQTPHTGTRQGRGGRNAFRGQGHFRGSENGPANRNGRPMKEIGSGATRNKRSVWTIPTQPYPDAHFATFPPKLIEPCILAGSKPGDVVLDPFIGAVTTGLVAKQLNRTSVGIDLNAEYLDIGIQRIRQEVLPLFTEEVPYVD